MSLEIVDFETLIESQVSIIDACQTQLLDCVKVEPVEIIEKYVNILNANIEILDRLISTYDELFPFEDDSEESEESDDDEDSEDYEDDDEDYEIVESFEVS